MTSGSALTHPKRLKLTPGMRFHRLTVVGFSHFKHQPSGQKKTMYECLCDCGKTTSVSGSNLTGGHPVKSCGCLNAENMARWTLEGRTHGRRHEPVYQIWANVVARGTGTEARANYYDRGIRVCERWLKFENFYEDMGDRPDGHSIDRIDNDGHYSPENCRWATPTQQARNTSRTVRISVDGEMVAISDVADRIGISPKTLYQRIKKLGWSVEHAISAPLYFRPSSSVTS